MKTVKILHPWMPHYRAPFFKSLKQLGNADSISYQIYAGVTPFDSAGRKDSHNDQDDYNTIDSKEYRFGNRSLILHNLDKAWSAADMVIAEHAIRNLVTYRWLFLDRPKIIGLWGHGKTFTKKKFFLEENLKITLLKQADWFFGYTKGGVDFVVENGFARENTTIVNNSTDTNQLSDLIEKVSADEIITFLRDNYLESSRIGVFIGAIDSSKRIDFLIQAAERVNKVIPNFVLLIFGDGPKLDSLSEIFSKKHFVRYCGRADMQTKALLSHISDFILMPGRVGLVAVDSFALKLPIITTNWQFHAPEFEYLKNDNNALISNDNLNSYVNTIIGLLQNQQKLLTLKRGCQETLRYFSIEQMASNFHQGVLKAFASSERKSQDFFENE